MNKLFNNKYKNFIIKSIFLSILMVSILIVIIIYMNFNEEEDNYQKAFEWQNQTKGVVSLTTKISEPLKTKMTHYFIENSDVNSLMFGSSTIMGIKNEFINDLNTFNAAKNSYPLNKSISDAYYYINKYEKIKYVIIGFDWSIGLIFHPYNIIKDNYAPLGKSEEISLKNKIKDALTYRRFSITIDKIINDIFIANDKSITYQCPTENATIGNDSFFDTDFPLRCHGFRADGSATFQNQKIVNKNRFKDYLEGGLINYKAHLINSKGLFEDKYFEDFKEIDSLLKQRNGKLIVISPPILSGITKLLENSEVGNYLKDLRININNKFKQNNIDFYDFSEAEKFGCEIEEFMDVHHAFPACYKKIFSEKLFIR